MKDFGLSPTLYPLPKHTGRAVMLDYYTGEPDFLFHYHPEYELVLTRGSIGKRIIGDTIEGYSRYDLVLLGPNLPHTWVSERLLATGQSDNIVLHFTRESLGIDFLAKPELADIRRLLDRSEKGLTFSGPAARKAGAVLERVVNAADFDQLLVFLSVLATLTAAKARTIASDQFNCSAIDADSGNLSLTLEYIHQHNDRPIRLEEIADHLSMSVPTFTRFFRRVTGKSFVNYLNEWRVRRACILLRETTWSVLEISLKAGFSNLSHFNRQFMRLMHTTPRNYRHAASPTAADPITNRPTHP